MREGEREGGRERGRDRKREGEKRESHIIRYHSIVVRRCIIYTTFTFILYLCVCIHVVCIKHSLSFIYLYSILASIKRAILHIEF